MKNKVKSNLFVVFILMVSFFTNCENEESVGDKQGSLSFGISSTVLKEKSSLILDDISSVLVSIKNNNGNVVEEKRSLRLNKFGDSFISDAIALNPGEFFLTAFMLCNAKGDVIYASPLRDSPLAYLVEHPLPLTFNIEQDKVTKVTPDIILCNSTNPESFGYSSFSFNYINTFEILLSVQIYDEQLGNYVLTESSLTINNKSEKLFTSDLNAITEVIRLCELAGNYEFTINKSGYKSFVNSYTLSELKKYETIPLIITLEKGTSLQDGLIAWYPFNGNSIDESINENNGTVYGATLTSDRFGNASSAYFFDGIDDYIDCGNNSVLNQEFKGLTIAAWIYREDSKHYKEIIAGKWNCNRSQDHYVLYINNEKNIAMAIADNIVDCNGYVASPEIPLQGWVHVAMSWDNAGNHYLYTNGELVKEVLGSRFNKTNLSSPVSLKIGAQEPGGYSLHERVFHGKIDDVRIYNRKLSQAEFKALLDF